MSMKIYQEGSDLVVSGIESFNLRESLECGQCFNFVRLDQSTDDSFCVYRIIAGGRVLFVCEKSGKESGEEYKLIFKNTEMSDYYDYWENFFDLRTDYSNIKKSIIKGSPELSKVIEENSGIRLLNQDFFETLISFIISQNKQIPQIKAVVRNISEMAGDKAAENAANACDEEICKMTGCKAAELRGEAYLFPTVEQLMKLSEDDIRVCKAGFRAPYIRDAVEKVYSGDISYEKLMKMSTDEARESLMTIKGVGEKVANCVLLYSLGRREAFPVDVWMKRIMEHLYFHQDTDKKIIEKYAYDKFGELAGYAQQYLFIYGKDNLKK